MAALHLSPILHPSHNTESQLGADTDGKASNRLYPYFGFLRRVRDPFADNDRSQRTNITLSKGDAERNGNQTVEFADCCIPGLAVHIWATKPNPLLLTKGASDPADVHSTRATLYIAERKARVFCEDRRVTMEFLYPRDIKCVVKHVTGAATPTVAVHAVDVAALRRRPPDDSGHFTVRKLPNGVVLRDPVRCKHSTWATILFSCKDREEAETVFTSLEALRVRRLNQPLLHPSTPEIQVVNHAVILQHRAREHLAKRGVRPEGVLAPPGLPQSSGATSLSRHTNDDERAKQFLQLPDVNISPREFEELMSSSSDDEGGSSSEDEDTDDLLGENTDNPRSQILRKVFSEPFVPVKQEFAKARLLLGGPAKDLPISAGDSAAPAAAGVQWLASSTTAASTAMEATGSVVSEKGVIVTATGTGAGDGPATPHIKSPPQPPSILKKVSVRFPEEREDISQSMGRSPDDEDSYEVLLGSPRDPKPSVEHFHSQSAAMVDALREKAETERRTAELIEKLRADLLLAAIAQATRAPATTLGAASTTTPALDPASLYPPPLQQDPRGAAAAADRVAPARSKPHDPYDSDSSVEFHVEGDAKGSALGGPATSAPAMPMPPQPKQPPKIPPRRVSSSGSLPQSRAARDVANTGHVSEEFTGEAPPSGASQAIAAQGATHVRSPVKHDEQHVARENNSETAPTAPRDGDDVARRRSNLTPVASSRFAPPGGTERTASSPYPHRGSSASRRHSSTSPARQRSTSAGDSSRRCRWCRNVAPESHDDRCAFRKIKCKKCNEVVLLKDRQSHQC